MSGISEMPLDDPINSPAGVGTVAGEARAVLGDRATIYQLFVGRHPGASLHTHRGEVLKRLQQFPWQQLLCTGGFNVVYLLGLFDNTGPIVVTEEEGHWLALNDPNRLPSVFAIRDHEAINPALGTIQEVKELIAVIQRAGGKVLVDFVGNHTALSHPWRTDHPEYFHQQQGTSTGFVEEFSGDVIKLNYGNPDLCTAQIKVLHTIASWGADGVRCDMAHFIPNHFWSSAFSSARQQYLQFITIAEAYGANLFDWGVFEGLLASGFTAVYHDYLFRNLRQFAKHGSIRDVVAHLDYATRCPLQDQLVHYVMNHDDSFPPGNGTYLEALTALLLFLPGSTLIFNGQLKGRTARLAHHRYEELRGNEDDFSPVPSALQQCLDLRRTVHPVIHDLVCTDMGLIIAPMRHGTTELLFTANVGSSIASLPLESGGLGDLTRPFTRRLLSKGQTDFFIPVGGYEVFSK